MIQRCHDGGKSHLALSKFTEGDLTFVVANGAGGDAAL